MTVPAEKPENKNEDLFWKLLQEKEEYNNLLLDMAMTYLASEDFIQLDQHNRNDITMRIKNLYLAFK